MSYPLKGIRVLEMEGLAPTVLAGQILADFGAEVTIISKTEFSSIHSVDPTQSILNRGKKSITLDLKNNTDLKILGKMMASYDVFIDSLRPGVMEKLGYGPEKCLQINPKLVYARISSFGQQSKLSQQAGHDINFLSYSGVLSLLASSGNDPRAEQPPAVPANIVGDFAAGSCLGVVGILSAIIESQKTGRGQIVDLGMAQASLYLSSFVINQKIMNQWNNPRGQNLLDGGAHFYNVYKCKDHKFISVGCIEPKFYEVWVNILRKNNVDKSLCDNLIDNHFNVSLWPDLKIAISKVFIGRTREEWTNIFQGTEACCGPVYDINELKRVGNLNLASPDRPLLICRDETNENAFEISPQPILSNMPMFNKHSQIPNRGQHNDLKPKL